MIIINDWRDMPAELGGACVAMGNFDGVHLGHAEVLRWAKARAQSIGAPLGLVTFEPHPRRFLNPTAAPFMIAARGQKEEALERLGIERLYRLRFDADLASMMADDFVRDVLWSGLKVREISVGFDFNFGKNRSGSAESLKALGDSLGMPVHVAEAVSALGQGKCSSSAIRAALIAGKPEDAAAMLGRPFAIRSMARKSAAPSGFQPPISNWVTMSDRRTASTRRARACPTAAPLRQPPISGNARR